MNNNELNEKLESLRYAKGFFDLKYNELIDFINKELKNNLKKDEEK